MRILCRRHRIKHKRKSLSHHNTTASGPARIFQDEQYSAAVLQLKYLPLWRVYPPRLACKAANTFSAVRGKSITRTPTASHTALAMAAATGVLLLSPMPLLW